KNKIRQLLLRKNKVVHSQNSAFYNVYDQKKLDGNLTVISYNIKYSRKIDKAIKLLIDHEDLNNDGILCLQEMTYEGVEKIAKTLQYNYIYYPAAVHRMARVNMGNAILSKWPIIKHRKLILPRIDDSDSRRIAVQATVKIEDKEIMFFSVHKEMMMRPRHRIKQVKQIIDSIPTDIRYCVIAGDFNTFRDKTLKAILQAFEEDGFTTATGNVKWSYQHWYFLNKKSRLDHIFSRGMNVVNSGHVVDRSPSDHLPIWAEFNFKDS
ncbi:MAG: endonuclease/exonuclease/phosphatase family protein, partial [Candidatus Omnitrophica bacterium]|nr:endonuclease/exonuclease/phosphatase family protein [Candidatus Omnitrophota bacterium]